MLKIIAAGLLCVAVATPGQASLPKSEAPMRSDAATVQVAGYWSYANCVAGRLAWKMQHGMAASTMLTPMQIVTAVGCFEAY